VKPTITDKTKWYIKVPDSAQWFSMLAPISLVQAILDNPTPEWEGVKVAAINVEFQPTGKDHHG
jgi:hypothetical protein